MARDVVVVISNSRQRKLRELETGVRLLGIALDSLKSRESANCDIEVRTFEVADARGNITNLVTGLY